MIIYPNAKINIGLNIASKRLDGYHNIKSVFYPLKDSFDIKIIYGQISKIIINETVQVQTSI